MIEPLAPELKSLFDEERSSHPDRSELRTRVLTKVETSIALGAGVVVLGAAAQGITATGSGAALSPLASFGVVKVAIVSFVVGGLLGGSTVAIVDRTRARENRVEVPTDRDRIQGGTISRVAPPPPRWKPPRWKPPRLSQLRFVRLQSPSQPQNKPPAQRFKTERSSPRGLPKGTMHSSAAMVTRRLRGWQNTKRATLKVPFAKSVKSWPSRHLCRAIDAKRQVSERLSFVFVLQRARGWLRWKRHFVKNRRFLTTDDGRNRSVTR